MNGVTIILFFSALFSILATSIAVDAITANQTIRDDGNGTIESAAGVFELGFFSPNGTKNRYVGIWYKRSKTAVVWVANRQTPLTDASGELRVDANGSLVLVDGATRIIWSSNSSTSVTNNPVVAQLLDDGNLVMRHGDEIDPENYLWQSFDHPANNFLQGIKLGWDLVKGLDRHLTSWKSDADPSPGNFTFRVNLEGYPRMMLYKDSNIQFRFGPWDGVQFNGVDFIVPEQSFDAMSVSNQKEMYYSYKVLNTSVTMRMELYPNGSVEFLSWNDPTQSWEISLIAQRDVCDQYALCGAYGNCDSRKSGRVNELCGCLQGYVPTFPEKWKLANWSDGCVRQTKFDCGGDKFVKYSGLKLPDTRLSWFDNSMDLEDCKNMCLKNCTCTAYSNVDIRQDGTGCMLWFGDLIDIRDFSGAGLDFYVRIAASELETKRTSGSKKGVLIAVVTVLIVLLLLLLLGLLLLRKRLLRRKETLQLNPESEVSHEKEKEDLELPLFDFIAIAKATNDFSINNKLGRAALDLCTSGYMSPEYALDGTFSVKSDVYSFGVLVLEIISGTKMRRFYDSDKSLNLLNYAWKLYREDNLSELIDAAIKESCDQFEVFRAIQIGLLCVNTYPEDRPSMAIVVSMMTSETELPKPMQPGVYTRIRTMADPSTSQSISNDLTVTFLGPR